MKSYIHSCANCLYIATIESNELIVDCYFCKKEDRFVFRVGNTDDDTFSYSKTALVKNSISPVVGKLREMLGTFCKVDIDIDGFFENKKQTLRKRLEDSGLFL